MALPTYKKLSELRDQLAPRIGFGGMVQASINEELIDSFIIQAQDDLYNEHDYLGYTTVDKTLAANAVSIEYPDELDPDRIYEIRIDYTGQGNWYPLSEGIEVGHDSVINASSEWQANAGYVIGNTVIPSTWNGYKYVATAVSGVSDASEPTWPTTVGNTVVDNGVTWTCQIAETTGQYPRRYDFMADVIEFWPRGQAPYTLRFEGIARLGAFSADDDRCTIPDNIVFLQALIYAKGHYKHQDIQIHERTLIKQLNKRKGAIHGNRRYSPARRSDRRCHVERVRPVIVDS